MVKITIDGRSAEVKRGTTVLSAAKALGIEIPTLCHHEGLAPEGNCRLCSVLVEERGRRKLVASCVYPINFAIEVWSRSPEVMRARRVILQLLVNRNPKSPVIAALCAEYGVSREERFRHEADLCIRCGRCARACAVNGTQAIEFAGRGFERRISTPYDEVSRSCIGCLSCQMVCPTGKITYEEKGGVREIWGRRFDLVKCRRCGKYFATREMLEWAGVPEEDRDYCENCRRFEESRRFLLKKS